MADQPFETEELLRYMEGVLPITARISPRLAASLQETAPGLQPLAECKIVDVHYAGDFGGIMCVIEVPLEDSEKKCVVIASLTHLDFDRRHYLARDIARYQKRRIKKLKRSEGWHPMVSFQLT
jgi:succinylarginine dihydrolase